MPSSQSANLILASLNLWSKVLVGDGFKRVFGNKSILYETDKSTHSLLRKLVGTSMTPTELSRAVPSIQAAANSQVDKMLQGSSVEGNSSIVEMESVCNAFTLDVAWRQILGLDLKNQKEIDEFHMYTKQWLDGLTDPRLMLPFLPGARFIKPVLAKKYLLEKVEQRLSTLDELGTSDGSSLGAIYFATDNDNGVRLTREQVIDNALILIVAGSETSASTLTMAISLLGRHKDVWTKIKDEQAAVISKFGTNLSKDILDHEMPYLEAVIKETLRLAPVPAMEFRKMGKTTVIDGMQIPKNYFVASSIRSTHEEDPATYMADGSHMDPIRGFKPQRWLSDGSGADEGLQIPSEWMPWGIGLRRCVGERLAMTEMKTFLATLARRVDFDLPADEDERVFKFKSKTFMAKPKDKAKIIPRLAPLIPSTTQS